jgi:hypothetical protein
MYEAGTRKWQECLNSSEEATGKNILRWLLLCDKADYEYRLGIINRKLRVLGSKDKKSNWVSN